MDNGKVEISKIGNGDPDGFYNLIKPYQNRLYTFLLRLSGNREDAEELLQDTFMRIYRNLSRFDGRASFQTWIYTIAMNQFKSYRRKKRFKQISLEALNQNQWAGELEPSLSPELLLEEKEMRNEILSLMGFLKPEMKAALVMKYMQSFSYQEIGKVLGISEDAAKMKVFRARKEILVRFGKEKAGV